MTSAEPAPTVALKHLALSIQTGPFGSQLHAEDYSVGGRPVVNPAHLRDGRIEPDPNVAVDEETFAQLAQHELKAGDVVIGRRGELGRCAVVEADQEGWLCGTGSIRLRPNVGKLEPRWLRWLLSWSGTRDWLSLASVGTTMENVGAEIVGGMPLPMVSISAQRTVADYLDRETARLDALVAAKERVLGLLAEKRRALITRAVTRGLDLRTPLRDSGIPWLGEIPGHWTPTRLKFVAEVRGGFALGKNYGSTSLAELPYLRVANVQDGHLDLTDVTTVMVPASEAATCMLQAGDVLMNEGGDADKLGRGAIWHAEISPCLHQNHVFAVRPNTHKILSVWLDAWTSSEGAKAYLESRAKQSTNLASISSTNIKEMPIPLPPRDEQAAIVERMEEMCGQLDKLRVSTEATVALLKERRAALIAVAVAGQLPVPDLPALV